MTEAAQIELLAMTSQRVQHDIDRLSRQAERNAQCACRPLRPCWPGWAILILLVVCLILVARSQSTDSSDGQPPADEPAADSPDGQPTPSANTTAEP